MSGISRIGSDSGRREARYIYDLPYAKRWELCNLLDVQDRWRELGGVHMRFNNNDLNIFAKAVHVRGGSPTDELLEKWGSQNRTILHLFKLLKRMEHYQAMMILKPYVDPRHHGLIREGNEFPDSYCDSIMVQEQDNTISDQRNRRTVGTNAVVRGATERTTERKISEGSDFDRLDRCVRFINIEEVEQITNFWDRTRLLGRGGFGSVYRATWKQTQVAIKRPDPQRANQVSNPPEVQILQSLKELKHLNSSRHDNILPLYAYSQDNGKYILIYQYMPNGSLEDRLHCRNNMAPLSWYHRYNIAKGTARGIQFLHEMDEKPLVHGDIKSANILLDEHLEPKIGDFGLAQEGPSSHKSHITLPRVHGTKLYLPPEFLLSRKLRPSVDTYSFGVVLCEIATGRKPYDETKPIKSLRDCVQECPLSQLAELMDLKAGSANQYSVFIFNTLIYLAKQCIELNYKDRPNMIDVYKQLDENSGRIDNIQRTMNTPILYVSERPPTPHAQNVQICPVERPNPSPTNQVNQPVEVGLVQEASVNSPVEPNLPLVPGIRLTPPSPNIDDHDSSTDASETSSHDSSLSGDLSENESCVTDVEQRLGSVSLEGHGTNLGIPNITMLQEGVDCSETLSNK